MAHQLFKPFMQGAIINNSKNKQDTQKVVNAYDNTIVYTDYIMNYTLQQLSSSKQNAAFFYFSDHGDQLFDKKMTPHGMPYKIAKTNYHDVTNPGAFVWFSNPWLNNINKNAFISASKYKNKPFSYDDIFSSILGCAGVTSKYVNKELVLCSN